jgi:dTDP-4-amino-4,6-dideoxygalactose transaminase
LTKRSHVYSRFPILVKDKLLVYKKVKKAGVDLGFTFSYKLPQYFPNENGKYPNTDYIIGHILNVPICRNMSSNKNIAIILEKALQKS